MTENHFNLSCPGCAAYSLVSNAIIALITSNPQPIPFYLLLINRRQQRNLFTHQP